jgi:hypothetical protein
VQGHMQGQSEHETPSTSHFVPCVLHIASYCAREYVLGETTLSWVPGTWWVPGNDRQSQTMVMTFHNGGCRDTYTR